MILAVHTERPANIFLGEREIIVKIMIAKTEIRYINTNAFPF